MLYCVISNIFPITSKLAGLCVIIMMFIITKIDRPKLLLNYEHIIGNKSCPAVAKI